MTMAFALVSGTFDRECPGWDSNPHWTVFETASSAGWDTGARAQVSASASP